MISIFYRDDRARRVDVRRSCLLQFGSVLLSIVCLAAPTGRASAESLKEALSAAYLKNPRLDAERARLRASDEEVPRAKAGYRPTITGSADAGVQHTNTKPPSSGDGELHAKGYSIQAIQPLFRGFRTYNTVNEAEANVRVAREVLRALEQVTLLDGVTAYMDVVRDVAILQVRESNVRVLTNELRATQERFNVGEVTRTDVAQATARRAAAVSALDLAKSNLRTSRATYERVIGNPPSNLREPPPETTLLPGTLDEAITGGTNQHPNVVAAVFREQGARHAIDRIRGELLPQVQLESTYSHRYEPSRTTDQSESASVVGRLNWQFYNGGEVEARVRQAKHTAVSRLQEIEQVRSETQAAVVQAWSVLIAARAQLESDRQQVESARIALTGVREEEKVGQRTLLDVLNAEQELLNAEVQLITTKRNLVVASYTLVSAVGRLSAYDLTLGTPIYDDAAHYDEVKRKWTGMRVEYHDGRVEDVNTSEGKGHDHAEGPLSVRRRPEPRVQGAAIAPLPATRLPALAPLPPFDPNKPPDPAAPLIPGTAPAVPGPAPTAPLPITPPRRGTQPVVPPAPLPAAPPVPGTTPPPGNQGWAPVIEKPQLRGSLDKPWTAKIEKGTD